MVGSSIRVALAVGVVALGVGTATVVLQRMSNPTRCPVEALGCPMGRPGVVVSDDGRADVEAAAVALEALIVAVSVLTIGKPGLRVVGVRRVAIAFGTLAVAIPAAVVVAQWRIWHQANGSFVVDWMQPRWGPLGAALILVVLAFGLPYLAAGGLGSARLPRSARWACTVIGPIAFCTTIAFLSSTRSWILGYLLFWAWPLFFGGWIAGLWVLPPAVHRRRTGGPQPVEA